MRSPPREQVLRFDAFTLDLSRCVLLRGNEEVALRPKPFDMLCYLAANPSRLLAKEELLQAVWRDTTVSDDALVKCIGQVREALGDRRDILKTIPRRGYLLDAEVSEEVVQPHSRTSSASPRASPTSLSTPTARGEGQTHTPTLALVAAPHPSPPPASWQRGPVAAVSRLLAQSGRRRAALLVAGVLVVLIAAAGAGTWALRAPPPVAASATRYAVLARAILDSERSAKANREALALFDKALAIDPDCIPALLGYARVMAIDVAEGWVPPAEHAARLDQGKAAAERAIGLNGANYLAHQRLGAVLRVRGDADGALGALERALSLNPGAAWTHALIGRVKVELGRAEEALADVETALRINPSELAVHVWYFWAGIAAVHAGKYEKAALWLQKAREAKPDYRRPIPLLALAYAETGRADEGRALIAEYLEQAPHLTIATLRRDVPARNQIAAEQRERMAAAFRRLGVPDSRLRTGSAR